MQHRRWKARNALRYVATRIGRDRGSDNKTLRTSWKKRGTVALVTLLLNLTLGTVYASAQAQLRVLDQPISKERESTLKKYLGDIDDSEARLFGVDFEGLSIFRLERPNLCLNRRCLTIVVHQCSDATCPYVRLLAEPTVYANPLYVEVLGGLRSVIFGQPGAAGTAVVFGRGLMLVTSIP
jgi:hypothetical protein